MLQTQSMVERVLPAQTPGQSTRVLDEERGRNKRDGLPSRQMDKQSSTTCSAPFVAAFENSQQRPNRLYDANELSQNDRHPRNIPSESEDDHSHRPPRRPKRRELARSQAAYICTKEEVEPDDIVALVEDSSSLGDMTPGYYVLRCFCTARFLRPDSGPIKGFMPHLIHSHKDKLEQNDNHNLFLNLSSIVGC